MGAWVILPPTPVAMASSRPRGVQASAWLTDLMHASEVNAWRGGLGINGAEWTERSAQLKNVQPAPGGIEVGGDEPAGPG